MESNAKIVNEVEEVSLDLKVVSGHSCETKDNLCSSSSSSFSCHVSLYSHDLSSCMSPVLSLVIDFVSCTSDSSFLFPISYPTVQRYLVSAFRSMVKL